jgi:hypothetical protein
MNLKSVFQEETRREIINRINTRNPESKRQWGKMYISQMAKHMTIWNEWILGNNGYTYKQEFIGKIFGKMMLKKHTKDESPMGKGMPAGSYFTVKEIEVDLERLKSTWNKLIESYMDYSNPGFIHDFYGEMTREQIGIFAYKHADHHLRQFNS